jgi:hypothetical protein
VTGISQKAEAIETERIPSNHHSATACGCRSGPGKAAESRVPGALSATILIVAA